MNYNSSTPEDRLRLRALGASFSATPPRAPVGVAQTAMSTVADAGWRATFVTASILGALGVAAQASSFWAPFALGGDGDDGASTQASVDASTSIASSAGLALSAGSGTRPEPGAFVSARALSIPVDGERAPAAMFTTAIANTDTGAHNGAALVTAAVAAQPVTVEANHADVAPTAQTVAQSLIGPPQMAHVPLSLGLPAPRRFSADASDGNHLAGAATPRPRSSVSGVQARIETWAPDWRPPSQRDLAFFVAADNEALSWSFSGASPNRGRLVYQDDRVEVGEMSAGLSVTMRQSELALAYMNRESPTALGYTARDDFAGVLWTTRR